MFPSISVHLCIHTRTHVYTHFQLICLLVLLPCIDLFHTERYMTEGVSRKAVRKKDLAMLQVPLFFSLEAGLPGATPTPTPLPAPRYLIWAHVGRNWACTGARCGEADQENVLHPRKNTPLFVGMGIEGSAADF